MAKEEKLKALYVETDPVMARAVELYIQGFSRKAIEFKSVASAEQAFALEDDAWDVLLVELASRSDPKGDVVHKIKEKMGHIPVVNLGEREDSLITVGTATTLDDFLPRITVSSASLLRSIRNLIGRAQLEGKVERLRHEMAEASRADSLTGLWNRSHLTERLAEEFMAWQRYGTPMTLGLFELRALDRINETYGFEVVDEVLRACGGLIAKTKRGCDLAGRFGDGQFAVLFTNTPLAPSLIGVNRIKEAIEHELFMGKHSMNFTVETNVAVIEMCEDHPRLDSLLTAAGQALRRAAQKGPGHIELNSPTVESQGARVLIVDDHASILNLCCDIFQRQGYRTTAAHTGAEALRALEGDPFNLYVIDLRLPDMEGDDLIARISEKHAGAPPLIVITGRVFYDEDHLRSLGVRHIVKKPFSPESIAALGGELTAAA